MKPGICRALAVGELSQWGRQFLTSLQSHGLVDIHFETDPQKVIESTGQNATALLVEAQSESRNLILRLREAKKKYFIIWFGRSFAKEDLVFAMDQRVYYAFENMKTEDKKIVSTLQSLSKSLEGYSQFEQLARSLKGILVQAENEIPKPVLNEIKTAVAKLEKFGSSNEFLGITPDFEGGNDAKVPFHKSQTFGDALLTVQGLERTGVLWVKGTLPGEEGKVEFLQGKIVMASSGEVHALKAIYRMFMWDEPKFVFTRRDPKEAHVGEQLDVALKYICIEGEEMKKRYDNIRRDLPPIELRIELEPSSLHAGTYLDENEFHTLASIVEFRQVKNVLDYNPLPDVSIYEALIQLRKNKMIRVVA
jgi:Domain of unknown function (DUF4388)